MNLNVAGGVRATGQKAGVVLTGGFQSRCDGGDVVKLPDLEPRPDGKPVAIEGDPHRHVKAAEVRVEAAFIGPQDDELAGLIGRHQQ